jgi:Ran GTPase-activating protein (RanGAP) involved in mRNA processing and transport
MTSERQSNFAELLLSTSGLDLVRPAKRCPPRTMPRRAKKPRRDLANEVELILYERSPNMNPRPGALDAEQVKTIALALAQNAVSISLRLSSKSLGDFGAVKLAKALGKNASLPNLDLGDNDIGNVGIEALGQALKQNNTLIWLNLSGNSIGPSGLRSIADALMLNRSLRSLLLSRCSVDDEGAVILADVLRCNDKLENLSLRENSIGDMGATALLDVLNEGNTTLSCLRLDDNPEISRKIHVALEEVVTANECRTRLFHEEGDLDLTWQYITAEHIPRIAKELAEHTKLIKLHLKIGFSNDYSNVALQSALTTNCVLTSLSLERYGVDDALAAAIALALHENATLQSLTLTGGCIGHTGAVALAEMLKINSSLTHLGLSKSKVDSEGMAEIANALTENSSLASLDLSDNNICGKGVVIFAILLHQHNHTLISLNLYNNPCIPPILGKFLHDMVVFNRWLRHSQGLKESVVPVAVQAVHKGHVWPRKTAARSQKQNTSSSQHDNSWDHFCPCKDSSH